MRVEPRLSLCRFFYFEVLIFEEYFTFKKLFADFTKYLRGKKIKDCWIKKNARKKNKTQNQKKKKKKKIQYFQEQFQWTVPVTRFW